MNITSYFNNCRNNVFKKRNLDICSNSTLAVCLENPYFSRFIKMPVYVSRLDLIDLTKLLRVNTTTLLVSCVSVSSSLQLSPHKCCSISVRVP
jgi:hypothetical protein